MRKIDYAVNCIQRALEAVQRDRFMPAVLSPRIPDYLVDLAARHPDDDSEFSKFVVSLDYHALENELLRQLLPENLRQIMHDYRKEHEELEIKKQNEIVEYNFDNARDYRDRQKQLELSIREMIADQELIVAPQLVDSVLNALGYNRS